MSDLLRELVMRVKGHVYGHSGLAPHSDGRCFWCTWLKDADAVLAAVPPPVFAPQAAAPAEPPAEHLADLLRRADQCASTFENRTKLILAKLFRDLAAALRAGAQHTGAPTKSGEGEHRD